MNAISLKAPSPTPHAKPRRSPRALPNTKAAEQARRHRRDMWDEGQHRLSVWAAMCALAGGELQMPAKPDSAGPSFASNPDRSMLADVAEVGAIQSSVSDITARQHARLAVLEPRICAFEATTPEGVLAREVLRRQHYPGGPGSHELLAAFARDAGDVLGVQVALHVVRAA